MMNDSDLDLLRQAFRRGTVMELDPLGISMTPEQLHRLRKAIVYDWMQEQLTEDMVPTLGDLFYGVPKHPWGIRGEDDGTAAADHCTDGLRGVWDWAKTELAAKDSAHYYRDGVYIDLSRA